MKWFWKVRIYNTNGQYGIGEIETERNLREIDLLQKQYLRITGCEMLIEGMSEHTHKMPPLQEVFNIIWRSTNDERPT